MSDCQPIPVIGLIGGIGSGKTSLAHRLARQRAVEIIDADRIGHAVLEREEAKQSIETSFGNTVVDADGHIDRRELARLVFGDDREHVARRRRLEAIVHPLMREEFRRRIEQARRRGDVDAILLDAAVLLEAGWDDLCDAVVFVDVPDEIRQQRVVGQRRWSREEWSAREASQLPLEEKRRRADFVVDNSTNLEAAVTALSGIVDRLRSRLK